MPEDIQEKVRGIIADKLPEYNLDHGFHWTK
jgi:hypothetical protein